MAYGNLLAALVLLPVVISGCGSKSSAPPVRDATMLPGTPTATEQSGADQKADSNQASQKNSLNKALDAAKSEKAGTGDSVAGKAENSGTNTNPAAAAPPTQGTVVPVVTLPPSPVTLLQPLPQPSAVPMPSPTPPGIAASPSPSPNSNIKETAASELLYSIYWVCFGRVSDAGGLAYWRAEMLAQRLYAANARMTLCSGSEPTIADIYFRNLFRDPDAAGMEYWLRESSKGVSFATIETSIQGSTEAVLITQTTRQNFGAVRNQREATYASALQKATAAGL